MNLIDPNFSCCELQVMAAACFWGYHVGDSNSYNPRSAVWPCLWYVFVIT